MKPHLTCEVRLSVINQMSLEFLENFPRVSGSGGWDFDIWRGALFHLVYNPFAESMEIHRHLELRISGSENLE